jgi:hypothetical protein
MQQRRYEDAEAAAWTTFAGTPGADGRAANCHG